MIKLKGLYISKGKRISDLKAIYPDKGYLFDKNNNQILIQDLIDSASSFSTHTKTFTIADNMARISRKTDRSLIYEGIIDNDLIIKEALSTPGHYKSNNGSFCNAYDKAHRELKRKQHAEQYKPQPA